MFSANQPNGTALLLLTIFTCGLALIVLVPVFLIVALAGTYTPRCTVCGQKKGSRGPSAERGQA